MGLSATGRSAVLGRPKVQHDIPRQLRLSPDKLSWTVRSLSLVQFVLYIDYSGCFLSGHFIPAQWRRQHIYLPQSRLFETGLFVVAQS